jgi:hypothetical protein
LEWRIRGNLNDPTYCSANNLYTFTWNRAAAGTTPAASLTVGTTTPTLALGVCSFDFRLKNTPTNLRPTAANLGNVTVKSALGVNASATINLQ